MLQGKRKNLGNILIDVNLITPIQLERALRDKRPEEGLGEFLIRQHIISDEQLGEVLANELNIPHVVIKQQIIDKDILSLIPAELAKSKTLMPIRRDGIKLYVAMADPLDYFAIEEARMSSGFHIEPMIASQADIVTAISRYYDFEESMDAALLNLGIVSGEETEAEIRAEDSPVVRLVNQIIENAVAQRSSDIHFDPLEDEQKVRYRVDGVLRTERIIPKHMQSVIIARIKIMGNLNITESRVPQDGRIKMVINNKHIDIRLSTLPTIFGEKAVMRILDLGTTLNDIAKLGFTQRNEKLFRQFLSRPNGIVLITGPTGSGKSSTLYAALNNLNDEGVNIVTVEDPVEYQIRGVNQIQVKEEVGLTFAAGLRSILRQDPDIVMIGEIRDLETAQISVRASLTGHVVLSTLHTNSAVESVSRLVDMGVEPFLLASSLVGVIAQRLVRCVCQECGEEQPLTYVEQELFDKHNIEIDHVFRGKGCISCNNTGYSGRQAIQEMLPINRKIKEMILKLSSGDEIQDYLKEVGLHSLMEDGLLKVKARQTTPEEVLRVAAVDMELDFDLGE